MLEIGTLLRDRRWTWFNSSHIYMIFSIIVSRYVWVRSSKPTLVNGKNGVVDVYIYTYKYIYIHTCTIIWRCRYICIYVCIYIYIYISSPMESVVSARSGQTRLVKRFARIVNEALSQSWFCFCWRSSQGHVLGGSLASFWHIFLFLRPGASDLRGFIKQQKFNNALFGLIINKVCLSPCFFLKVWFCAMWCSDSCNGYPSRSSADPMFSKTWGFGLTRLC